MCGKPATDVNEIVPKSHSKTAVTNWKNRVTLCKEHHWRYHYYGTHKEAIQMMQDKRAEFLRSIGREEYV